MAKKPAKAKAATKQTVPAKKAAKSISPASAKKSVKPAVKPATKPVNKASKTPSKSDVKTKPVAKNNPVAKVAVRPAVKIAKPAEKSAQKPASKQTAPAPKTIVKSNIKTAAIPAAKAKSEKVLRPAVKTASKTTTKAVVAPTVKPETKKVAAKEESKVKTTPVEAAKPVEAPKVEKVKTVEQQMQEKTRTDVEPTAKAGSKTKEELFVPKYQLPSVVETPRPMRPRPPSVNLNAPVKPVANPIYVPPAPDGKPGIKFAPVAILAKPKEKPNKSEEEDMSSKTSPRLAFNESDDKKGISVEAKLRALYGIQLIDSRIDKIHAMRGELPLEVQDLEDDVAGLETRISNLNDELKNGNEEIISKKNGIKNSEALIKKYKEQLNNVKNNREYDSLNKEIEFQELEIQLHNKRIKEYEISVKTKQDLLESTGIKLVERTNDLKVKRTELDEIISSTEKEEKILRKRSDEAKKMIEARLLSAYERIRSGAPNGMAVVPIEREASAGSFIQLPPQKQLDVAARRRVIVDEHSGRILVDAELAQEEQEKMANLLSNEK